VSSRTQDQSEETDRAVRFGFVVLVGGCCAVVVAALVLIWSGVTTASARFSGSTTNDRSLFEAAVVDVVVGTTGGDVTELRIDSEGLYPGRVVDRCLPVQFNGSIDGVTVRLIGRNRGGTGLDEFVDTVVEVGEGSDNECGDFVVGRTEFEGTLGDLWQQHGDFETGLEILESANDGDNATVRIQMEVESDNQAQGLTSAFSILIEARP
jgi:hypothetical protein